MVSRYAALALIVALSPGRSDITGFRSWSLIAAGRYLDRAEKFQLLLKRLSPLTFVIRAQAFRDPLRGELSHVHIFMNPTFLLEISSCSAIDLADIRRPS